jgi:hypothetical protein
MLVAVQFSMKISTLTNQVKNLAQDNALLREAVERMARAGKIETESSKGD